MSASVLMTGASAAAYNRSDLWAAVVAGERAWRDGTGAPTNRERIVAVFMAVALATTVLMQWVAVAALVSPAGGLSDTETTRVVVGLAGTASAAALATRPVRLLIGPTGDQVSFAWSIVWRSTAYVVLIASTAGLLLPLRSLGAVPVGVVGGADAWLTLSALGITPRPARWLGRFAFSTLHFGVLGAMLATVMLRPERGVTLISLYVGMWVGAIVSAGTLWTIDWLNSLSEAQRAHESEEIRSQERSYRAHWLHDDVLSEVRLTTLRIADNDQASDRTRRELLDLDHRLRLRQLDESMRGGTPHVYEILQPHLRRAQALGVDLVSVPSLETTGIVVDETSSRLINRVVAVVMSNALNAGATRLAVDLEHPECGRLVVRIVDDAGGFDASRMHHGRGLANLARDLGGDAITVASAESGSEVTVRIPITSPSGRIESSA